MNDFTRQLTKAVGDVIDVRLHGLERLKLISGNLHALYSKLKLTVKFGLIDSSSDFQTLFHLQLLASETQREMCISVRL